MSLLSFCPCCQDNVLFGFIISVQHFLEHLIYIAESYFYEIVTFKILHTVSGLVDSIVRTDYRTVPHIQSFVHQTVFRCPHIHQYVPSLEFHLNYNNENKNIRMNIRIATGSNMTTNPRNMTNNIFAIHINATNIISIKSNAIPITSQSHKSNMMTMTIIETINPTIVHLFSNQIHIDSLLSFIPAQIPVPFLVISKLPVQVLHIE